MNCCRKDMKNWSYYEQTILEKKVPHYYCSICGSHYFKNTWFSADGWFFYINETKYKQQAIQAEEQRLLEESPHAHELINRE